MIWKNVHKLTEKNQVTKNSKDYSIFVPEEIAYVLFFASRNRNIYVERQKWICTARVELDIN